MHFLDQSLQSVLECRKAFYHRELAKSDVSSWRHFHHCVAFFVMGWHCSVIDAQTVQ